MDKFEFRRLALKELVASKGKGGQAAIARETGIAPDYISRMLAPEGKKSKKNIAEDMVEKLNSFYPGWLDIDMEDVINNPFSARKKTHREQTIAEIIRLIRETEDAGLDVVLHSATLMQEKFPIAQQTSSSQ